MPESAYSSEAVFGLQLFPEDQKIAIYLPFFGPTVFFLGAWFRAHGREAVD